MKKFTNVLLEELKVFSPALILGVQTIATIVIVERHKKAQADIVKSAEDCINHSVLDDAIRQAKERAMTRGEDELV